MIDALRTPPAYRRSGPDRAPLDYETCRAKALGLSVAYSRRLTGLDLDTAAARAQLTPGELAAIEDGTATPTTDTLFVLADVYRTDATELLAHTLWIAGRLFDDRWRPGR